MSKGSIVLRSILVAAALLMVSGVSGSAHALVLTFEEFGGWEVPIPNGYGGLNWSNTYVLNGATYGAQNGYTTGVVSGTNVAFNGWGSQSVTSDNESFTFNGGYFTSAWVSSDVLTIRGYSNGNLVNSVSTTITQSGPLWVAANFAGINSLTFSTSQNSHFALDNFTFNEGIGTQVPELDAAGFAPALTLLVCAMAMLLGRRSAVA